MASMITDCFPGMEIIFKWYLGSAGPFSLWRPSGQSLQTRWSWVRESRRPRFRGFLPLPLTTLRRIADFVGEAGTYRDSLGKESRN